jgi:hypothetical protein
MRWECHVCSSESMLHVIAVYGLRVEKLKCISFLSKQAYQKRETGQRYELRGIVNYASNYTCLIIIVYSMI